MVIDIRENNSNYPYYVLFCPIIKDILLISSPSIIISLILFFWLWVVFSLSILVEFSLPIKHWSSVMSLFFVIRTQQTRFLMLHSISLLDRSWLICICYFVLWISQSVMWLIMTIVIIISSLRKFWHFCHFNICCIIWIKWHYLSCSFLFKSCLSPFIPASEATTADTK